MDRQTLVLGSGVVALVAAPGADATTKNMGSSEDNNAAVARTRIWLGLGRQGAYRLREPIRSRQIFELRSASQMVGSTV